LVIGDFNVLATILRPPTGTDPNWNTPAGDFVPIMTEPGSPTVARRVWARVEDVRPSRQEGAQQNVELGKFGTYVQIRWIPIPLDSSLRVVLHRAWGDETYSVVGGPAIIGNNDFVEFKLERYTS
jgi:hypothetical protein